MLNNYNTQPKKDTAKKSGGALIQMSIDKFKFETQRIIDGVSQISNYTEKIIPEPIKMTHILPLKKGTKQNISPASDPKQNPIISRSYKTSPDIKDVDELTSNEFDDMDEHQNTDF